MAWVMLWALPADAGANCLRKWDTAEVARSGQRVAAAVPLEWFQGIDIVRRKIDEQSGITTTLYLCDSSEPNAYADYSRGRKITAITTGMYRLLGNDWQAYAALIGHENAHHVLQHMVKRMTRGVAFAAITSAAKIPDLGTRAITATFSRTEESDADIRGLRYALCAGFSVSGALRLHEKLNSASSFLHAHPSSKSRIKILQQTAKAHGRNRNCG